MPEPDGGPVVLYGVSWEKYEALLAALGDDHGSLRLTYCEGTLEIMNTSNFHELVKKLIARLVEIWALERDATLTGYGGTTFRKRAVERGLEPDECYVVEDLHEVKDALPAMPDIAIEVVYRHRYVDKLDVYAGLGVPEVWIWEKGRLVVHHLVGNRYERRERSELLPQLDLQELSSFVRTDIGQTAAVRAYRDALLRHT